MKKQLTIENWAEPDTASTIFAVIDEGRSRAITGDDVARLLLHRRLTQDVPSEIRELFDAGVGIGLYGWFYYPLFQLSANQLRRVADRAIQLRVQDLGGPGEDSFKTRLRWLTDRGVLTDDEHYAWTQTRLLRNEGSHPRSFQPVHMPMQLASTIQILAERIEALWESAPSKATQ